MSNEARTMVAMNEANLNATIAALVGIEDPVLKALAAKLVGQRTKRFEGGTVGKVSKTAAVGPRAYSLRTGPGSQNIVSRMAERVVISEIEVGDQIADETSSRTIRTVTAVDAEKNCVTLQYARGTKSVFGEKFFRLAKEVISEEDPNQGDLELSEAVGE